MKNGKLNGANGHDPDKVTSLEEARRRARGEVRRQQSRSLRDLAIGGLMLALGLGGLYALVGPWLGLPGIGGSLR